MPIDSPSLIIQSAGKSSVAISLHQLGYSPDCRLFTVEVVSFLGKRTQGRSFLARDILSLIGAGILWHPDPFAQDVAPIYENRC